MQSLLLVVASLFSVVSFAGTDILVSPIHQSIEVSSKHNTLNDFVGGDVIVDFDAKKVSLVSRRSRIAPMNFNIVSSVLQSDGSVVMIAQRELREANDLNSPIPELRIVDFTQMNKPTSSVEVSIEYTSWVMKKGSHPEVNRSLFSAGRFEKAQSV